ncbi:hypothetical protein M0802_002564 [Mischocyttarus mexicanus]|nr:hypothetical protein M0802_002564 [Mischocyttarus mexicanus]
MEGCSKKLFGITAMVVDGGSGGGGDDFRRILGYGMMGKGKWHGTKQPEAFKGSSLIGTEIVKGLPGHHVSRYLGFPCTEFPCSSFRNKTSTPLPWGVAGGADGGGGGER